MLGLLKHFSRFLPLSFGHFILHTALYLTSIFSIIINTYTDGPHDRAQISNCPSLLSTFPYVMAQEFEYWQYRPSLAGAIVATIIFFGLSCFHGWRLFRNRTWFCIPFVVGGIFEAIGYAARGAAHNDDQSLGAIIIQSLLILLAPILFAASIYMILSRIIRRARAESHSIMRPTWVTRIFVVGDVLCFIIQGVGGAKLASAKSEKDTEAGDNIVLGGLILQIAIFLFFLAVAVVFHVRLYKRPTSEANKPGLPWQRYMVLLYAASFCITLRNVLRCLEYGLGEHSYLQQQEWPLYVYDAVLMVTTLVICVKWYDPNIRPDAKSEDIEIRPWS